ncbi:winged helix-turn-helix transcriptional regulator [Candidatus Woesearchaeota archaeon]|jgi:sugar-specific transcriptional regulator TrmB|nr:winged helix-turn-helix transcriptional regulator [Candidatus Woesearchaeota archaeon]MBT6518400.1 winged helix-turn-helix transcriptional regulator [Candidatus Woesearchaeota archaeon]MBT7366582.1 winged helix-turn-helix transcriptional regulator [Candidatus Woesearchaeota archaeon]
MLNSELKPSLIRYGLKEKESNIYLTLLAEQKLTAQEIANKTGLIRQVVYDHIKKLVEKGLINEVFEGRTKKFQSTNPEQLLTLLKEKEAQIKEVIPKLKKIKQITPSISKVASFTGIKGLMHLLNFTLTTKKELLWIANYHEWHKVLENHQFFNYTLKRIEKKIKLKILIEKKGIPKKDIQVWKSDKKELRETKTHSAVKNIPSSYVIFDDKVIIFNLDKKELKCVLIEDKSINKSQSAMFNELWKNAKRI